MAPVGAGQHLDHDRLVHWRHVVLCRLGNEGIQPIRSNRDNRHKDDQKYQENIDEGVTLISEAICPVPLPLSILTTTSFVTQP